MAGAVEVILGNISDIHSIDYISDIHSIDSRSGQNNFRIVSCEKYIKVVKTFWRFCLFESFIGLIVRNCRAWLLDFIHILK